ncbi:potassium ABC transporter ATPase [Massilia sp. CF038]|nr:potassium ABC transporter ATPase [Massilia sp. CF038]SHH19738.1 hypothetical protein SAMN05428948_3267 [Massilia sp. CF038]
MDIIFIGGLLLAAGLSMALAKGCAKLGGEQ